jgi:uncharacterized protein with ParB-like and HNH nuclease domain
MNAEAGSFTFLGNEAAVRIPFFQRAYVWEQSNWEDLLTDLLDDTKTHFLGSLILKQQKKQSGKPKEVLVIDGQQRLTTLSILVKTIYDCFPEDLKSSSEASLRTHLFYKQHPTDKHYHVKIQHSQCDAQYYRQVVESGITPAVLANISETSNRILRCYKYFLGELSKRNHSDIEALFNRILDHDNRILVLIDLGEDDEEQAIFDTINSAGVRLSAADIIKNALFQRALELIESQDEVLQMYKDDWEAVFAKDDAAIVYWDAERSTGRLMRDNIEILLHSVAVINGIFDPDKHSLSALSALYKAVIAGQSEDELRRFIAEIKEYALLYKEPLLSKIAPVEGVE